MVLGQSLRNTGPCLLRSWSVLTTPVFGRLLTCKCPFAYGADGCLCPPVRQWAKNCGSYKNDWDTFLIFKTPARKIFYELIKKEWDGTCYSKNMLNAKPQNLLPLPFSPSFRCPSDFLTAYHAWHCIFSRRLYVQGQRSCLVYMSPRCLRNNRCLGAESFSQLRHCMVSNLNQTLRNFTSDSGCSPGNRLLRT